MSHNNFKVSDGQAITAKSESGDAHLSSAREEISNSTDSQFVGSMRQDTSTGIIPSGNVDNSGSITFGPGDGHNHSSTPGVDAQSGNHSPGDGHNHSGSTGQSGNQGDGHDHSNNAQFGNHSSGDGHNHNDTTGDLQTGSHSASDGHNHSASTNAQSSLATGDVGALNEQTRMSQDAARLGLGARDIALMQQLEGSVPHSSPRELAERLRAGRNRGGILDLSRQDDSKSA